MTDYKEIKKENKEKDRQKKQDKRDKFKQISIDAAKKEVEEKKKIKLKTKVLLDKTYSALVKYKFSVTDAANYLNITTACMRYRMIKMKEHGCYEIKRHESYYEVYGMATNEERLKYYDQISRR